MPSGELSRRAAGARRASSARKLFVLLISGLTGILTLGAFWTPAAQVDSKMKFTLEVAMGDVPSGLNFADVPTMGRVTVVLASGNIFPAGTLSPGDTMFDPTDPDDIAIGIWRCQFVSLGPTDFPLTGAVTYFFRLERTGYDSEESMIIVQGLISTQGALCRT